MHITVSYLVGCGGTGSHLALPLAQLLRFQSGTRDFVFFDGDNYESNNFTRQVMSQSDLDKNKAVATVDRLQECLPTADLHAVDKYLDPTLLSSWLAQYDSSEDDTWQLLVLAVDNDYTRHELIKCVDSAPQNVIVLLPGNGYHTSNVLWYMSDKNGQALPVHPFDLAANWAKPQDRPRYSCQYEADSSPQLIVANASAAFFTLSIVRALLDGRVPPCVLNYDDDKQTLTHEGVLRTC
jgi:hypothetical protein